MKKDKLLKSLFDILNQYMDHNCPHCSDDEACLDCCASLVDKVHADLDTSEIEFLQQQMKDAIGEENYEEAARLRDIINGLST